MGVTIIGASPGYPRPGTAALVEVKQAWGDAWTLCPELVVQSMSWSAAGHGLSEMTFERRHGQVKLPWDTAFRTIAPTAQGAGWWCRVRFAGPDGLQTAWIGKIQGKARDRLAQQYQAYGPLRILQKIDVGRSLWLVDGAIKNLGWVPSINDRDRRNMLRGNRSDSKPSDGLSHVYGGKEVWSFLDYAQYLLARFVDESATGGPTWSIAGETSLIAGIKDVVKLYGTRNVADLLGDLIPPRLGVDWTIVPTDDGFVVWCYSLASQEFSYADHTIPKNPNTVEVQADNPDVLRCHLAESADQGYAKIRVYGKRIVVCTSLYGPESTGHYPGSSVPRWDTTTLQNEYYDGAGEGGHTVEEHDDARRQDKFRLVFQAYGAPDDWDLNDGWVAPKLDDDGSLDPADTADYQRTVRRTLTWTPLREGFDYSTDPPTDRNPADALPDFKPPQAWIGIQGLWAAEPTGVGFLPAEEVNVSVSTLQNDWGLMLSASPNHFLAKNHWPGAAADTNYLEYYDYEYLAMTLAMEADQRLEISQELQDATPSDGVLEIEVPDAEYWLLAPHTMIGVDSQFAMQTSGATHRILRNDIDQLKRVMAGAIARYRQSRIRAEIVLQGLRPWGLLVGQILTAVMSEGTGQWIGAPITSVTWSFGQQPTTTIRTGFAG